MTLLFAAGTITMTLPFSFLVNIGNGVKAINSLDDGNPPFGYAEYATLEDFCLLTHIDKTAALKRLEAKSITLSSSRATLREISAVNNTSPKSLFLIIRDTATKFILPTDLPVGIARKSLARLQQEYWIELDRFIGHLAHYGIKATPESTFKKLAKEHDLHPAQLYNMLLASQVD